MVYVFMVFALIAFFYLLPLLKKSPKRDRIIVAAIFVFVLAVCALTAQGVELPNPLKTAEDIVKAIGLSYPPLK